MTMDEITKNDGWFTKQEWLVFKVPSRLVVESDGISDFSCWYKINKISTGEKIEITTRDKIFSFLPDEEVQIQRNVKINYHVVCGQKRIECMDGEDSARLEISKPRVTEFTPFY